MTFVSVMVCALTRHDLSGYVTKDGTSAHVNMTHRAMLETKDPSALRKLADLCAQLASELEARQAQLTDPEAIEAMSLELERRARADEHQAHVEAYYARMKVYP